MQWHTFCIFRRPLHRANEQMLVLPAFASKVAFVSAVSFAVNIPLGSWRSTTVQFSPQWFIAIHASVPAIVSV